MAENTDRHPKMGRFPKSRFTTACLAGAGVLAGVFSSLFLADGDGDRAFFCAWTWLLLFLLGRAARRSRLNPGRACAAVFESACLCALALWCRGFAALFSVASPRELLFSMSVPEGLLVLGLLQLCLVAVLLRQLRCIGNALALAVLCLSLWPLAGSFQRASGYVPQVNHYVDDTPYEAGQGTSCNFFR